MDSNPVVLFGLLTIDVIIGDGPPEYVHPYVSCDNAKPPLQKRTAVILPAVAHMQLNFLRHFARNCPILVASGRFGAAVAILVFCPSR